MSRDEEWTHRAVRDLRQLDRMVAQRVSAAITAFVESSHGDVVRLQGVQPAEWRLRVGDIRVRFTYDQNGATVRILRILPRGRAYRD